MPSESGIITIMSKFPILYWPFANDEKYILARKTIGQQTGSMPEVLNELDVNGIFEKNPDATLYYPVFCESTGWWGELLGSEAKVTGKMIVSPECQLMAIEAEPNSSKRESNKLLVAEIYPSSGFFKQMSSAIATVSDMLATETGTILALFSGKNQNKFVKILEATGNSYLGSIGSYS